MEDTSPLRVVAIGGGTGLVGAPAGPEAYTPGRPTPRTPAVDITAIVTVSDDGGSSGRLRREFDVLPPGDIRNCMVALSEDSALLSRLFQYRFASRPRAERPQLRQSVPDGADARHGRLSRRGQGVLARCSTSPAASIRRPTATWRSKRPSRTARRSSGETRISRSRSRIESRAAAAADGAPAAGYVGSHCGGRRDHVRTGVAVHQRDSQPAGERDSAGHPQFAGGEGVLREPDVAAGRDHEFPRLRPHPRDSPARRAASCSITPSPTCGRSSPR